MVREGHEVVVVVLQVLVKVVKLHVEVGVVLHLHLVD